MGDRATGCHYSRLYTKGPEGPPERVIADTSLYYEEQWPDFDRAGEWIYFTGMLERSRAEVWRVRTDGTGAERVGPEAARSELYTSPSLSEDGERVLFASREDGNESLQVLDLSSGVTETLPLTRPSLQTPRWSPGDSLVAFWSDEAYYVGRPDGTGTRRVASAPGGGPYAPSWSPDGGWLAVVAPDPGYAPIYGRLALWNVASGELLPLAWTSRMTSLIWRP